MTLHKKITSAPKADLHVHLEGTIEAAMMFDLAARNGVTLPWASVAELHAAFGFRNLPQFLEIFYAGLQVLRTERDFFDVTYAFLKRSAADNVVYTEIHFSPQGHLERGVTWTELMDGILGAATKAERELGIRARPILGLQRHRSEEDALAVIDSALPWKQDIVALGMGGAELGNPPSRFVNAYARARELGWKCTCHAGEEGPHGYVTEALDLLKVDRIDHGIRSIDNPALVARLARERMPLTVCPYSNVRLQAVPALAKVPLIDLLDAGCLATVNTDDPSYFEAYLNENFLGTARALNLTEVQTRTLIENGFKGAFLDEGQCTAYLDRLDAHWT